MFSIVLNWQEDCESVPVFGPSRILTSLPYLSCHKLLDILSKMEKFQTIPVFSVRIYWERLGYILNMFDTEWLIDFLSQYRVQSTEGQNLTNFILLFFPLSALSIKIQSKPQSGVTLLTLSNLNIPDWEDWEGGWGGTEGGAGLILQSTYGLVHTGHTVPHNGLQL